MKARSTKELLRVEVSDFGPIVKGKLDLRPFTVFVGPSNTGKSWMAILIYSLHRHFSDASIQLGDRLPLAYQNVRSRDESSFGVDYLGVEKWLREDFHRTLERDVIAAEASQRRETTSIFLPEPMRKLLQSLIDAQGRSLCLELQRCFGTGVDRLTRTGSRSNARIVFGNLKSSESDEFDNKLTFLPTQQRLRTALSEDFELSLAARDNTESYLRFRLYSLEDILHALRRRADEESHFWPNMILKYFTNLALPSLVGELHRPAFYFPADRSGVMHTHSLLVRGLIKRDAMTGIRPVAGPPGLSGVLADFLDQLIDLDSNPFRMPQSQSESAAQIEKAILRGSIRMERAETTRYPRFTYQPEGWRFELPLRNASSMVSELAPVVLYLRYRVAAHNVIIVEEPESHLHPAMQVEFTRQLATLVQAGIRVIITTHSEWILEELANIVRKSSLKPSQKSDISNSTIALDANQVGVWLFKPSEQPKGSVIKEIGLDESGLFPSGFDEVATTLHNDWADIASHLDSDE